jgi:hypothetical protein
MNMTQELFEFNIYLYNLFSDENKVIDFLDKDVYCEPEGNIFNLYQNIDTFNNESNFYAVDNIRWKSSFAGDNKPHIP